MGLLDGFRRLFGREERKWPDWMKLDSAFNVLTAEDSVNASGVSVTQTTALNYLGVWAAVNVIAAGVAGLPIPLYRIVEGGRERQRRHHLDWLLNEGPNDEQTPIVFWETLMLHVLIAGNAYAEIRKDNAGRVASLDLMDPNDVQPERVKGKLRYKYKVSDVLDSTTVFHVPGLGWDGVQGYSPITIARQSIGLGIAAERFGASFFGGDGWPAVAAEFPGKMTPEAQDRFRASWKQTFSGAEKGHRLAVLEQGMKLNAFGLSQKDSQFLETRAFQVEEICRLYRVPQHKLFHKPNERPGGNMEQEDVEFVQDTLRPWTIRIEQEINRKLIPERERPDLYAEFLLDGRLRGDIKTRYDAYATGRQWGWLSANDIRRFENMNPVDGGDVYIAPGQAASSGEADGDDDALRGLLLDVMGRMIRVEALEARRAAKGGAEKFAAWVDDFYPKHEARVCQALTPALRAVRGDHSPADLAETLISESREALLDLRKDNLTASVDALVSRWEIERPAELAAMVLGGSNG